MQAAIGGEGDFVQRRDEARSEHLGQKQRLGIEAKIVRGQDAPGDEDIGLALHDPETVRDQQGGAEFQHMPRAAKIEAGEDVHSGEHGKRNRPAPENRDRRDDQGPHSPVGQGGCQANACADEGRQQVDHGGFFEIEGPA